MQLLPLALLLLALSAPALARRGLRNFDGSYEGVELPEDFCKGKSNGRYSVEGHCEMFATCFDNKLARDVESCPPCHKQSCGSLKRMVFDESSGRCEWPGNDCSAKCGDKCKPKKTDQYLYVWAGPENRAECNDTVFVLDATPGSPDFGTVVAKAETPYRGTEPHHIGLSGDGKRLGVGGMLSVLVGAPDHMYFDVSDPTNPKYTGSSDPETGTAPDEWVPTPDGGWLVAMMGGADAGGKGGIAKIDSNNKIVGEYPPVEERDEGLNPHGITVDYKRDRMVTSDYLKPGSILGPNASAPFELRTTFRVWKLSTMEILKTYDATALHSAGFMDARVLGDTGVALLTSGKGELFAVNITNPEQVTMAHYVHDQTNHCLMAPFDDGKRVLGALFGLDMIVLLDTSEPFGPYKVLQEIYLPKGSGPHAISISPDEKLAAVSTYFIDCEKTYTLGNDTVNCNLHRPGSRKVHFIDIARDKNSIAEHEAQPTVDFSGVPDYVFNTPQCGGWRPHDMEFSTRRFSEQW